MRNPTHIKGRSPARRFFIGRIFPLLFVIAGTFAAYLGSKEIRLAHESSDWPRAEGKIIESDVERERGRKQTSSTRRTTYHARIYYEFKVDGAFYSGDRVAFGDLGSSDPSHARSIVNKYPKGKKIEVSYMPDDPTVCVIETGIRGGAWLLPGIGSVFILIGLLLSIFLPRAL